MHQKIPPPPPPSRSTRDTKKPNKPIWDGKGIEPIWHYIEKKKNAL